MAIAIYHEIKTESKALKSFEGLVNDMVATEKSSNIDTEQRYGMFNWYAKCLKNYANFQGRARRKEYWYFALVSSLISIIL